MGRRDSMLFTIGQNGMLDCMYNLIYRLLFTIRDLIERHMTHRTRRTDMECATQVVFGNMIDMGDHVNGHPGMNSAHIPCFDSAILVLETSHRLESTYRSKDKDTQHKEQQKPE